MSQAYQYSYPLPHFSPVTAAQYCQSPGGGCAPLPGTHSIYTQPSAVRGTSAFTQEQTWSPYAQQAFIEAARAPQYPAAPPELATGFTSWFDFSNSGYFKGLLIGAGLALLMTNPAFQHAIIAGSVRIWSMFQGGLEEMKEQVRDIQAEMSQKNV